MTNPSSAGPINLALIQCGMSLDPIENRDKATDLIRKAATEGAQLVILPELFLSRYFCQAEDPAHFSLAETVPGPSSSYFEELSKELNVSLVLSLFEKRTEGLYHNTVCVIDPERGYLGKYRKLHIPHDPLFEEKYYFSPGDLGVKVFETQGISIGTLICWDQWFPETARVAVLMGAQLLCYPTAIGWHPAEKESHGEAQMSAWQTIQKSHAVANGCFVAAINRVGFEPTVPSGKYPEGIEFWGRSFMAGPDGTVLAEAGNGEEVVHGTIDLSRITEQRHGWPFLRDRRTDAYDGLMQKYLDEEMRS